MSEQKRSDRALPGLPALVVLVCRDCGGLTTVCLSCFRYIELGMAEVKDGHVNIRLGDYIECPYCKAKYPIIVPKEGG